MEPQGFMAHAQFQYVRHYKVSLVALSAPKFPANPERVADMAASKVQFQTLFQAMFQAMAYVAVS